MLDWGLRSIIKVGSHSNTSPHASRGIRKASYAYLEAKGSMLLGICSLEKAG